jgi:hypothetical protein
LRSKDDDIAKVHDQLERRSLQQKQLLDLTHSEIDLYKQQLESKKQQAKAFLEKKQQEFLLELENTKKAHEATISDMEAKHKADEAAWIQRTLALEGSKFELTQKLEAADKECQKAQMEASSLKQMLQKSDNQIRQLTSDLSTELSELQTRLVESQRVKELHDQELLDAKKTVQQLQEDIVQKVEQINAWKDSCASTFKKLDDITYDNNVKQARIEELEKFIMELKEKLKQSQSSVALKMKEMLDQWNERRKRIEDIALREWKKRIQLEIEMEHSRILDEKLSQLEDLASTLLDPIAKEKLLLVISSLRDFWNQEKLRKELESHLTDLRDHLELQKDRLDEETVQLGKLHNKSTEAQEKRLQSEAPNLQFIATGKLHEINMATTKEMLGLSSTFEATLDTSIVLESSKLEQQYDTLKSKIQHEITQQFRLDDEENNLKKELMELQTKVVELLDIIEQHE